MMNGIKPDDGKPPPAFYIDISKRKEDTHGNRKERQLGSRR